MKTLLKLLLVFILFTGCLGAAFFVYAKNKVTRIYDLPETKEVLVEKGFGLNRTAHLLEQNGVIDKAEWFILYAWLSGFENNLKAGEYAFKDNLSYQNILDMLSKGQVVLHALTIPEGKVLYEIKQIVMNNPYLTGEITLDLKEGEILPETYHFTRGEQRDAILAKAREAMKKTLKNAFEGRDENLPVHSEQELLILASIVEKETGLKTERAQVASVFVNRLRLGMRLQTDPTVIYAVTDGKMNLGRPIYRKDLAYDSPYNTYVYAGLPPAPICSPGRAAIYAAAHPDETPYLYFVADGETGGHRFGRSLDEHNANVAHYRGTR